MLLAAAPSSFPPSTCVFVGSIVGVLAYALVVVHVVRLALGAEVGFLEWIATAIAGTAAAFGVYFLLAQRDMPWPVSLGATLAVPPLLAAFMFGFVGAA